MNSADVKLFRLHLFACQNAPWKKMKNAIFQRQIHYHLVILSHVLRRLWQRSDKRNKNEKPNKIFVSQKF